MGTNVTVLQLKGLRERTLVVAKARGSTIKTNTLLTQAHNEGPTPKIWFTFKHILCIPYHTGRPKTGNLKTPNFDVAPETGVFSIAASLLALQVFMCAEPKEEAFLPPPRAMPSSISRGGTEESTHTHKHTHAHTPTSTTPEKYSRPG